MPKYLTKWPDEALWAAWLAALGVLLTAVLAAFGVEPELAAPIVGFVLVTGRLFTGAVLPTPSEREEIADVREHADP